jgi:hypothetical protein
VTTVSGVVLNNSATDVNAAAINGGETYLCRRSVAVAGGLATSSLVEEFEGEEEEEEDVGEAAATTASGHLHPGGEDLAVAHAGGLMVYPPSFGLTPPEEEGLKTTDGILKVDIFTE